MGYLVLCVCLLKKNKSFIRVSIHLVQRRKILRYNIVETIRKTIVETIRKTIVEAVRKTTVETARKAV